MATKSKEQTKLQTLTLPVSGLKVEFNPADANGNVLFKCREATNGGMGTVIYILAEIATFNGEKIPAPELMELSAYDIIELETAWAAAKDTLAKKE